MIKKGKKGKKEMKKKEGYACSSCGSTSGKQDECCGQPMEKK